MKRAAKGRRADARVADESMKELVLQPLIEEPATLSDTVFTWEIENWRQQNKKEHGPIFQAAGFPWYVLARQALREPRADTRVQADITFPLRQ